VDGLANVCVVQIERLCFVVTGMAFEQGKAGRGDGVDGEAAAVLENNNLVTLKVYVNFPDAADSFHLADSFGLRPRLDECESLKVAKSCSLMACCVPNLVDFS
jgi:hypothetical protein